MSKGPHYTEAEDVVIRQLARTGVSYSDMSATVGRSSDSIRNYACRKRIKIARAQPNAEGYPSSYISGDGVDWSAMAWDRLAWQYGADHADRISAGNDPKTQADLAAWRKLGRRSAA